MRRREFMTLLGGAWPVAVWAQQQPTPLKPMPVVAFMNPSATTPFMEAAVRQGLSESGYIEVGRSTGYQMGQILNGTNPGDIPYNLVAHYELALNLKTAKSLDLEFPPTLLGSADLVVE